MPDVNSFETLSHSFIPCCRQLTNGTKKRAGENLTTEDVRNWIYLLEQTLTLSSWMKLTSIDKNDLRERIRLLENDIDESIFEPSLFQREIRRYMRRFKRLVTREKEKNFEITKFHHLLHLYKYVLHHGSPANFDGSRPEAVGKFLIKNPGRKTQIRLSLLTLQTAHQIVIDRNISDFAKMILRVDPQFIKSNRLYHLFKNCNTEQELVYEDIIEQPEDHGEQDEADENFEQDIDPPIKDVADLRVICSGSKFSITHNGTQLSFKWLSRTNYTSLWSRDFLNGLTSRLFTNLTSPGGTIIFGKDVVGFCSMTVSIKGGPPVVYHSHPNYRSGLSWHDWVLIDWGESDPVPARLMMILDMTLNEDEDFIYFNPDNDDDDIDKIKSGMVYLVIHSAINSFEVPNEREFKYHSRLSSHIILEEGYCIVPLSSLVGPAYVISNISYLREDNFDNISEYIHVKDHKDWGHLFINRIDSEFLTYREKRTADEVHDALARTEKGKRKD